MVMPILALMLFAAMMLIIGALRRQIQLQRTGDSGNRRSWRPDGSLEWWALAIADLGYLMVGAGAPLAAIAGMPPLSVLEHPLLRGAGIGLAAIGIAVTLAAQLGLGASWRIGIDETERTALVTTGSFAIVRNPIFTAVILTFSGLVLIVPNPIAVAGLLIAVVGIEVQVRGVEEPYLHRVHGRAYTDYTTRVGRFLPGLGRTIPERSPQGRKDAA